MVGFLAVNFFQKTFDDRFFHITGFRVYPVAAVFKFPDPLPEEPEATFIIKPRDENRLLAFMRTEMSRRRARIETPVLTDIRISFEDVEVQDVEPAIIPDLFAGRSLLYGNMTGPADGRNDQADREIVAPDSHAEPGAPA